MPQAETTWTGPWQKVLACTDGSDEGQNAVAAALQLARDSNAKVVVIRVVDIQPEFTAVAPDIRSCLEEEIQRHQREITEAAAKLGVQAEMVVKECQQPHAAIVAEATRQGADLIITGRYGKTGFARLLIGNVSSRVIGHSPVSVLVVPLGAQLGFQRLLMASDGSPYSAAAFDEALALARQWQSELYGVVVAPEEGDIIEAREILHHLLVRANQEGWPLKGINPQGLAPDEGIVQAAIRNEVDLIIMGSHGRTGFLRLLMGSVTARVIGTTLCPVLVVKKK